MGDELREVKTRFTFESDREGVQRARRVIVGLRSSLVALGAVLGVGLGGKALTDLGLSAEQASERLRGATNAFDSKKIITAIGEVQTEFDNLNKTFQAGQLFTPAEGELLGAAFFENFEEVTTQNIDQFKVLLGGAITESVRTGEAVNKIFVNMLENAKAGSIEALRGLPEVTEKAVRAFAASTAAFVDPIDPFGGAQLEINMKRVIDVLRNARPASEAFVASASKELITFRTTGAEARETFQDLGTQIVKALTPGLDVIRDIFKQINDGIPVVDALATAFGKVELFGGDRPTDVADESIAKVTATPFGKKVLSFLGIDDEDEEDGGELTTAQKLKKSAATFGLELSESEASELLRRGITKDVRNLLFGTGGSDGDSPIAQPNQPARELKVTVTHKGTVTSVADIEASKDAIVKLFDQAGQNLRPSEVSR